MLLSLLKEESYYFHLSRFQFRIVVLMENQIGIFSITLAGRFNCFTIHLTVNSSAVWAVWALPPIIQRIYHADRMFKGRFDPAVSTLEQGREGMIPPIRFFAEFSISTLISVFSRKPGLYDMHRAYK